MHGSTGGHLSRDFRAGLWSNS